MDLVSHFIEASVWHGTLEASTAILAAHPEVADANIHVAAVLGDNEGVRRFIAADPSSAAAKGGPRGWDPLTHLCFSKYLRLDPSRSAAFLDAATALLDAGASASTGFFDMDHRPSPVWESALYGAAGVAHHADLTRLLLARGANPNDEEAVYHSPETHDNGAMRLLVETGALTDDNLALMLLRKHDWHDYDGVEWLLDHGIDVNRKSDRWRRPLHHAISRDNALPLIELLLDRGADPMLPEDGETAAAMAARRGRGDLLEAFDRRGLRVELRGVERLIAACARNDTAAVYTIASAEPELLAELLAEGADRLAQFAGIGNTEGVGHLLDLGVPITSLYDNGGLYFGIPRASTALHVAAWFLRHATVRLLLERGAPVNVKDGAGRTPLTLAVQASVQSYWTDRRSPESIAALLDAGASVDGVLFPSGYVEADELVARHRNGA
ncbi:MAG TPA: ankyrin repeat domain-containing protein [Vicinamibacterales bacterium]|nr:ankyrin repeat domain-containing protein [Vicinamibacterales bacterium]